MPQSAPQDAEPARDSVTSLAQTLMEYLSRPSGDIDCTDVCHMIHTVKDVAIPIVQPHMTEKNWTKIGTLAGFYGSPDVRIIDHFDLHHFHLHRPCCFAAVRVIFLE